MEYATAENGWVNTIDSKNPQVLDRAKQIIENTRYCSLSTCSADGYPWITPVFFAYDENWFIYWSSAIASQHSQNLYRNQGRMALAVYDSNALPGEGKGVYLNGVAGETTPEQAAIAFKLLIQRTGKPAQRKVEDYMGESPRRIYCFQPQEVWVSGDRIEVGNQLVDTKIRLALTDVVAIRNS